MPLFPPGFLTFQVMLALFIARVLALYGCVIGKRIPRINHPVQHRSFALANPSSVHRTPCQRILVSAKTMTNSPQARYSRRT